MKYEIFSSPIGNLTVSCDGSSITSLHIEGDRYFTEVPSDWTRDLDEPLLKKAKVELEEYFSGARKKFTLPLDAKGTLFQQQVWEVLASIPSGSTTTYGSVATKAGNAKAIRAVGTAIGRNPICIFIPCHRVLGSGGGLGGFVAGLEKKEKLLQLEAKML
jgi:methylated-DNA-[protein]-cysteine S-methyltransferase